MLLVAKKHKEEDIVSNPQELAQAAVNSATILQAVTDIGRDCTRDEIGAILKVKDGYFLDMTRKLNNMKKGDLLHSPNVVRGGRNAGEQSTFNLTEHGKDHLERFNDRVQEYGDYDYGLLGRTRPPKNSQSRQHPTLDLQPALTVSPAVQKAMDELAEVASDNEHCHKALLSIKTEIDRFNLLSIFPRTNLAGTMAEIEKNTRVMHDLILGIGEQINAILDE